MKNKWIKGYVYCIITVSVILIILSICYYLWVYKDPVNQAKRHGRYTYTLETKADYIIITDDIKYDDIIKLMGKDVTLRCGSRGSLEDNKIVNMKDIIAITDWSNK